MKYFTVTKPTTIKGRMCPAGRTITVSDKGAKKFKDHPCLKAVPKPKNAPEEGTEVITNALKPGDEPKAGKKPEDKADGSII